MTKETSKQLSKRQELREKRRKQEQGQRIMMISMIVVGALLVAAMLIYPNLPKPVGEITTPTFSERPLVNKNSMGDPNAPVKIDVWEDFQCPACAQYSQEVETQVTEAYVKTGKVLYTFHFFPFLDDNSVAKESDQSASASMCAADQGKFWEYHDMLFANWNGENEGAFNDTRLVAFAETLSLNMDEFNACFRIYS